MLFQKEKITLKDLILMILKLNKSKITQWKYFSKQSSSLSTLKFFNYSNDNLEVNKYNYYDNIDIYEQNDKLDYYIIINE